MDYPGRRRYARGSWELQIAGLHENAAALPFSQAARHVGINPTPAAAAATGRNATV
jgi:hypothetical protein